LLGGWITDNISWPWIFYINVPVGLGAALVAWRIYAKRETERVKTPIDSVGLGLLVLWVGALQVMLDKGKELGWFESSEIIGLGVVALVGFAVFVAWELTEEHPVVDLRLFARRNFWVGTLSLSLAYGLFFGNIVLLPMWLQQFMGYTATYAGFAMAPVGLLAILLSPYVGKNIAHVDPRRFATIAFTVFAVVLWMRSGFTQQADFAHIMVPTIIQGAALAFFFVPLSALTLSGLTIEQRPAASGLSNFARITAGSMGTSLTTTLWDDRATMHHSHLAEQLQQGSTVLNDAFNALRSTGMSLEQAAFQINRMMDQQAFTRAADDIFLGSALLFLALIPVVWLSRPVANPAGAPVDAGGAH